MATPSPTTGFSSTQTSAFDILKAQLAQWGLSSLNGTVASLIRGGVTDTNELQLSLENTQEWKTRFAGNVALKAKGLPVLSVSEYLATEKSYAQTMKQYGLPPGFYDDPADFAEWIGNSVSPNEINQRAAMYSDLAKREDPAVTAQLKSMGMHEGDLLAYMIDPSRAMPLIQQKYQTTLIGAAARRAGVTADNAYAQHLADLGVTEAQAAQGYGQIGAEQHQFTLLGDISGNHVSQGDLEAATFESNADATNKLNRLASQERARFQGSAGTSPASLSRSTAGQF